MVEAQFYLTEQEHRALNEISQLTGKSSNELLRQAVDQFIERFQMQNRRELMQKARGIWKDRQDLATLEKLRRDWDRL